MSHLTPYIKTLSAPREAAGLADELGLWAGTVWSSRSEPAIAGTIGVSQPVGLHLSATISETLQLPINTQTVTVISTATETKTITITEFNKETIISAPDKVLVPDVHSCTTMSIVLFLVGVAAIGALVVYDPGNFIAGHHRIKGMCNKLPWMKFTAAAMKRNEKNLGLVGPVELKAPANVEAEEAPASADSLVERDDSTLLIKARPELEIKAELGNLEE